MRSLAWPLLPLGFLLFASWARADADGAYGRFHGDLDVSLAAGAVFRRGTTEPTVGARALYLGMAGLYGTYSDAFVVREEGRRAAAGVTVRPLFLPRWSLNMERGPAWLDLLVDSVGLEMGVLWSSVETRNAGRPGFEVAAICELPLFGTVRGLWLGARGSVPWSHRELSKTEEDRLSPTLAFTLSWHEWLRTHAVDVGDSLDL